MADDLAERIIDTTIALAEERGWGNVRLYLVAQRLEIELDQIGDRFRDLDAIANAWFGRARQTMMRLPRGDLIDLSPPERIEAALLCWFDALAAHRKVAEQILRGKLHLSHPHHWVPMIFDLSRLMHDVLDVARIASTGRQREMAEVGLTLIFLTTLREWLRQPERAIVRLGRRLAWANRAMAGSRLANGAQRRSPEPA